MRLSQIVKSPSGTKNETDNPNSETKALPLRQYGYGSVSTENKEQTDDVPIVTSAQFATTENCQELSNFKACMHLLKSSLGTGALAMPAAIRDSGLVFGTLSIAIISLIISHSVCLLLESAQYLRHLHSVRKAAAADRLRKQMEAPSLTYSTSQTELHSVKTATVSSHISSMLPPNDIRLDYYETVRMTFLKATPSLRRWAWIAKVLNGCLITNQLGTLTVYLIFVAENTKTIVDYYDVASAPQLWVYFMVMFALIIPLVFVKTLSKLAILSSLANVIGLGGLILIVIYCLLDLQPVTEQPQIRGLGTLPLSFGVIVFAFECINVMLPLENQMLHREDMRGWFGVLSVNMTVVTAFYIAIGFFGYLRFGQYVDGAITYNIPMTPFIFGLTKPMYTISIFISFTLQFYVLFSVLWEWFLPFARRFNITSKTVFWFDCILRLGIVTLILVIAMTVPYIELVISFVGSFASASIALIIPPLVHSVNTWMQIRGTWKCHLIIGKNILMIGFGILGALVGSGVSLGAIISKIKESYTLS